MSGPMKTPAVSQASVIRVVRTIARFGDGTSGDRRREITQYWDEDGKFLAEYDPCRCELCGALNCTSDHK